MVRAQMRAANPSPGFASVVLNAVLGSKGHLINTCCTNEYKCFAN